MFRNQLSQPSYSAFESFALLQKALIPEERTIVEFVVGFLERAKIDGNSYLYDDPYVLVQLISGAQGACFMHSGDFIESYLNNLAGKPVLENIAHVPPYMKIALLDAFYYHLNELHDVFPSETVEFAGLTSQKSRKRAEFLRDLSRAKSGDNVLIVGVIDDIVEAFMNKSVNLKLADFARANMHVMGRQIENNALPYIDWADILIITGNVLKTNTLWEFLPSASHKGKRVVIYAMTGINIAPHYLQFGANIVTTENFPYYWYANTISKMSVYKSENE